MKAETLDLRTATPGDIGFFGDRFGKVISYPTPGNLVTVEFRMLNRPLRDKRIEEVSGDEPFTKLYSIEARDAAIYDAIETPEEYLTVTGRIVRVIKKEEHSVWVLSSVTESLIDVSPTYRLIPISDNNLESLINNLRQNEEERLTGEKKPVSKKTTKPKAAQKGDNMAKSGEPKAPSRRQVILDLLENGVSGTPVPVTATDELVKLVKERFPEHTDKDIRNAVSVGIWHFKRGARVSKTKTSEQTS